MPVNVMIQPVEHLPAAVKKTGNESRKKVLTTKNNYGIILKVKNKAELSTLTQKQLGVWC